MNRITVAVASPSDVPQEREAVKSMFLKWNDDNPQLPQLHPKMWEFVSPELGEHPQQILNKKIIANSDLLIAIFHSKLGTPTPNSSSGTVEEIHEFAAKKGAGRVMLYFCKRPLPVDIDPAELSRLNKFKKSMRSEGLFNEFTTTDEFARELYRHIDVKAHEFLENKLPLPTKESPPEQQPKTKDLPADPRLHKPIDFGTNLDSIATGFQDRMAKFNAIDGCTNDKFYALGAQVYTSVATCLDRFLVYGASNLEVQDQRILEDISSELKFLASNYESLGDDFRDYWKKRTKIARDLVAHADHIKRRIDER
jgi:hypothetical protein